MNTVKYPYIAQRLIEYIEEKISSGQYPAGYRIASLRNLAEEFDMDIGAARRAMDYLSENGLIVKRPGSGNFVSRSKPRKGSGKFRKIAVFLGEESLVTGVYATVLLGMQKTASEKELRLLQSFNFRHSSAEQANLVLSECDGAVLLGADEYGDTYKKLSFRTPIVAVCSHENAGGAISTVDIDPFSTAVAVSAHFKEKGVSKVVVVSHPAPSYLNRGKVFASQWVDGGGMIEFIADKNPELRLHKGVAYLFTSGGILQVCHNKYSERTGRELASDYVVVSIDGKHLIDPSYAKGPSMALDWQLLGRYALEECLYRIDNPGALPKRIYLPGKFHA